MTKRDALAIANSVYHRWLDPHKEPGKDVWTPKTTAFTKDKVLKLDVSSWSGINAQLVNMLGRALKVQPKRIHVDASNIEFDLT